MMVAPQSPWSTSWLGFVAPAYTPLVRLAGLGLIGRRLFVPSPFRWWMYVGLACGFVFFQVSHASLVYGLWFIVRPIHFGMQRRQLLNLKARVEASRGPR